MTRQHYRFLHPRALIAGLGGCVLFACAPSDRTFNEKPEHGVGGAAAGSSSTAAGTSSTAGKANGGGATSNGGNSAGTSSNGGGVTVGGATSNGGGSPTGGASSSGGAATNGGASSIGGTVSAGGTSGSSGGVSNTGGNVSVGGASTVGGSLAVGGQTPIGGSSALGGATVGVGSSISAIGGSLAVGGTTQTGGAGVGGTSVIAGGATATGGQPIATGGSPVATGGVSPTGGAVATGGTKPTGGNPGTGGSSIANCKVTETPEVSCNDGVDNDCNGAIDCPGVGGRYPAPGVAAAGDDVWVHLNPPSSSLKVQSMQCRFGKPGAIGGVPWTPCIVDATDTQRVYSMSGADAQLASNDGVTQFDFRFQYTSGAFSEPRSIVYYAHSSLWDGSPTVPTLECKHIVSDADLFAAAQPKLVTSASQEAFTATDVQLKNPFVMVQFTPPFRFGFYLSATPLSAPEKISVLSLRHRFLLDPARQIILVTRTYKAIRNGSCLAASLQTRESSIASVRQHPGHFNNHCDAIVMNKAGSGVCLVVSTTGTIKIPDIHSATMTVILEKIGIKWPSVEATMWQKLFSFRGGRNRLEYFSPKCIAGDTSCPTSHPGAPMLPDSADPYFASP